MAEQQNEPEAEEQDEQLRVEKEKLRDLDVPEEESKDVTGGEKRTSQCSLGGG